VLADRLVLQQHSAESRADTTDSVQRITGHPAPSIDDFAKDIFVPAALAAGK